MNTIAGASGAGREDRLKVLLRRRHGQEKRERLKQLLSEFSTTGWNVVLPPDSDPVTTHLFESIRSMRETGRLRLEEGLSGSGFQAAVGRALEGRSSDDPTILVVSDVSEIGIVEADAELARACARSVLDHDRDSVIIADPQAEWGLVGQRFEDSGGVTYQIETW